MVLLMMLSGKQLINQMNNAAGLAAEGHPTSSHVALPTTIVGSLEFLGYELEHLTNLDIPNFLVHPKPMQPNYLATGRMSFYCMTLKFIRDSW
jgi:hypothetical protein